MIDVLIDTGSAGMGVPVANFMPDWKDFEYVDLAKTKDGVIGCNDMRCRGHCDHPDENHTCSPYGGSCTQYNGQDTCSFYWRYGDGSRASGVAIYSELELGGITVNATFGGITQATKDFFEAPNGGGIMGMAYGNYSLCDSEYTCFRPIFDSLVEQGELEDRFAICASKDDAKLVLGGGDERLYQGNLTTLPLIPPYGFYWVEIKAVMLGDQDIMAHNNMTATGRAKSQNNLRGLLPTTNKVNTTGAAGTTTTPPAGRVNSMIPTDVPVAMIDTGNSALFLPRPVFLSFKNALIRSVPMVSQRLDLFEKKAVMIPDEVVATMPNLVFHLDMGVNITLTPADYLIKVYDRDVQPPVAYRALKLAPADKYVFGQTVLNQ